MEQGGGALYERNVYTILHQEIPASRIDAAIENPDALAVAYDVGALEAASIAISLVGIGLTALALVLASAAFFGFWMIRRAALDAARREARTWMDEEGPRLLDELVRRQGANPPAKPNINMTAEEISDVIEKAQELPQEGESKS